jgi:outer membrane immunogenic protein
VTTAVARIYPGNPHLTYVEGTNVTTDWLSTLGWAIDKVLVYGAGGVALTDLRVGDTSHDNDGAGAIGGSNISKLKAGWTLGAGVEYFLWRNWTVRGEYLYVDLGSVSTATTVTNPSFPGLSNPLSITGKVTGSIGRAALNYRF